MKTKILLYWKQLVKRICGFTYPLKASRDFKRLFFGFSTTSSSSTSPVVPLATCVCVGGGGGGQHF